MQWRAAGVAAAAVVEAVAVAVVEAVAAACLAAEAAAEATAAALHAEVTAAEPVAVEGTAARHPCRGRPVGHPRRLDPPIDPARAQGTAVYPRPALGLALALDPEEVAARLQAPALASAAAPLRELVQVSLRVLPQELGRGSVLVPAAWRVQGHCRRAAVRLAAT